MLEVVVVLISLAVVEVDGGVAGVAVAGDVHVVVIPRSEGNRVDISMVKHCRTATKESGCKL
jgi:hypothetical protein